MGDVRDVVVVGGGPAGVCAAISAARNGARTTLVERGPAFGGAWTLAMQAHATCFHDGEKVVVGGLAREIIGRLGAMGAAESPEEKLRAAKPAFWVAFDHERMKCLLDDMTLGAGVEPLLHSLCTGVLLDGRRAAGVVLHSKSGETRLRARVVIDCSGDADAAFYSGAATVKGRDADGLCQPATTTFLLANVDHAKARRWRADAPEALAELVRAARERGEISTPSAVGLGVPHVWPGVTYHNVTRVLRVDATNARDLTRAEMGGRRQARELAEFYQRRIPGFERSQLIAIAGQAGLRESRRIRGEYVLTEDDVLSGRRFPDAVARHAYYVDVHNPDGAGLEGASSPGRRPPKGCFYEVPYRCLLPEGVEQMLVAGRCISATREALGSARTTVCCAQLGEAAGLAAAWAAREGGFVRQVNGERLRARLFEE